MGPGARRETLCQPVHLQHLQPNLLPTSHTARRTSSPVPTNLMSLWFILFCGEAHRKINNHCCLLPSWCVETFVSGHPISHLSCSAALERMMGWRKRESARTHLRTANRGPRRGNPSSLLIPGLIKSRLLSHVTFDRATASESTSIRYQIYVLIKSSSASASSEAEVETGLV